MLPAALAADEIILSPGTRLDDRLTVTAGQAIAVTVTGPASGQGTTGTVTDVLAGREVLQVPLARAGEAWSGRARFESPGPHVLAVRLYQGAKVWGAAVDLTVLAQNGNPLSGEAREALAFAGSSGRKGGDVNGWWGIAAMLVIFAIVILLAQPWKRRT